MDNGPKGAGRTTIHPETRHRLFVPIALGRVETLPRLVLASAERRECAWTVNCHPWASVRAVSSSATTVATLECLAHSTLPCHAPLRSRTVRLYWLPLGAKAHRRHGIVTDVSPDYTVFLPCYADLTMDLRRCSIPHVRSNDGCDKTVACAARRLEALERCGKGLTARRAPLHATYACTLRRSMWLRE